MGSAERTIFARRMLMAFGLMLGDRSRIGQKEFCLANDKWVVGLGLLPRVSQPYDDHFQRSGRANQFRRFMLLATGDLISVVMLGVLMAFRRLVGFMDLASVVVGIVVIVVMTGMMVFGPFFGPFRRAQQCFTHLEHRLHAVWLLGK
jgi:hypothetical protein